jgi:hypothetical protein
MNFTYVATGVVKTHGCFDMEFDFFFVALYPVGSVAYDKISAKRGRMEAVSIKRVEFVGCDHHPLYTDNLNTVYTESDLVSHDEAKNLAIAYYNRLINQANNAIELRNC